MTHAAELPAWAALATAAFRPGRRPVDVYRTLGLLRFGSFYDGFMRRRSARPSEWRHPDRLQHFLLGAPTRPVLHELLIAVFVTTTPVTLVLLVRATLYRDPSLQ